MGGCLGGVVAPSPPPPCDVRTTSKSIIVYTTIPANFQFGELNQGMGVASAWGGQFNLDSAIKSSRAAIKSSDIQPFVKVNNEKRKICYPAEEETSSPF